MANGMTSLANVFREVDLSAAANGVGEGLREVLELIPNIPVPNSLTEAASAVGEGLSAAVNSDAVSGVGDVAQQVLEELGNTGAELIGGAANFLGGPPDLGET